MINSSEFEEKNPVNRGFVSRKTGFWEKIYVAKSSVSRPLSRNTGFSRKSGSRKSGFDCISENFIPKASADIFDQTLNDSCFEKAVSIKRYPFDSLFSLKELEICKKNTYFGVSAHFCDLCRRLFTFSRFSHLRARI